MKSLETAELEMKYLKSQKDPPTPESFWKHQVLPIKLLCHQKLFFLVLKCKTVIYSCRKAQTGSSEFCKWEGNCRNIWNVSGNIENDREYSDEEEYGREDEDSMDKLLE